MLPQLLSAAVEVDPNHDAVVAGVSPAVSVPVRLRLLPVRDPWVRLPYEAPLAAFGDGARRGFDWVFEGESSASVTTFDDVLDWLAECRYATDAHLFQERDIHPVTANTRDDARNLLRESADANVLPHVRTYPLERANEALAEMKRGRIDGTGVLLMDAS